MILEAINPKTGVVWHVDVPIDDRILDAAKRDLGVSLFVLEASRQHLPAGFMLLGGNLKTP
ncbi:hypothetical protein H8A95_21940 [Bradyrhizobium sp. Pear76]|uniref:hypothetical protein n=1 Tax=Bradyrhizobium oropedii TaxID=1571201 RepID=UPI001E45957F|nr:hypothetical protein [Bradyrhizobium oropedii]MCC8964900.1 hypothetical protein [Bradyrhizobium oropedii]